MSYISDVFVTPIYPSHLAVTWNVSRPSKKVRYYFDVFLSDNPESGFEKINKVSLIDQTFYDIPYTITFKNELLYVKVEMRAGKNKSATKAQTFVSKVSRASYGIAKTIVHQKNLARRKLIAVPCSVRKRKIIGEPCSCVDVVLKQRTKSECRECFDTGIVGGYSEAIDTHAEIVEGAKMIMPTELGSVDNSQAMGYITAPLVFKNDIIIEIGRNKRWRVHTVDRSTYATLVIDQQITMKEVSPGEIEHEL